MKGAHEGGGNSAPGQVSRRRFLKITGAVGAAAALEGVNLLANNAPDTSAVAPASASEEIAHKPTQEKVEEQKSINLSWMTEDHWGDLVGMMYHGHNAGALAAYAAEGWQYDQNGHASRENMPWGGKCTVVYNKHTKPQKAEGISVDLFTREAVFVSVKIRDLESQAFKVPIYEQDIVKANMSAASYVIDIQPGSKKTIALLSAAMIAEVGMALSGYLMMLLKKPTIRNTALATYLMSGYGTGLARGVGHKMGGESARMTALLTKVQGDIPTALTFLLTRFRNVLAAEKNVYLATQLQSKHMATEWGASHAGIETEMTRSSEERIAFLRKWKPLVKLLHANATDSQFLWTCPRVVHSEGRDGTLYMNVTPPHIEVPSLKALFTNVK